MLSGIKHHIEKISGDEFDNKSPEFIYDKEYDKIKFLTDDLFPLNRLIYFTVVIRCVFKQDGVYYPQVYLDDCLYQI